MSDEFFEWFRAQDPERFLSKELAAKDAWNYQQVKLQVAVEALEKIYNHDHCGDDMEKTAYLALEKIKIKEK